MRIFVALDIDEAIRNRIAQFLSELRRIEPDVKWVKPDSFHITLKFVGEKSAEEVEKYKRALAAVRGHPAQVEFKEVGFFPTSRSPRVFWVGIHGDEHLSPLARAVDEAGVALGIPGETQEYHPHLTLARSASGSPRPKPGSRPSGSLQRLAERLAGRQPEFGRMTAHEFYLYESRLSPGGARYTKLARFALAMD